MYLLSNIFFYYNFFRGNNATIGYLRCIEIAKVLIYNRSERLSLVAGYATKKDNGTQKRQNCI